MKEKSVNEIRAELEKLDQNIETGQSISGTLKKKLASSKKKLEDLAEQEEDIDIGKITGLSEFTEDKTPEETHGLDKLVPNERQEDNSN